MVVKSKIGRKRYILFEVEPTTTATTTTATTTTATITESPVIKMRKREIILLLVGIAKKHKFRRRPYLIQYNHPFGIVRCTHWDKNLLISALNTVHELTVANNKVLTARVKTLKTSGTIRKMRNYLNNISSRAKSGYNISIARESTSRPR